MSATARLSLPYIAPLQAQKQYSYNSAMALLDQLVQPCVISRTVATPPGSPAEGDTYIVAASATGAWAGHSGDFASLREGAWTFCTPADGWLAFVNDTSELAVHNGGWQSLITYGGTALAKLGINATADFSNRLAVAAAGTLLTHDGGSHRLTVNKAASGDTASLLLQDGFSGRAEIGLVGDDALHVKISADGLAWMEALSISQTSGAISLPRGQLRFPAAQNASADANTLDDYEEGTWTPSVQFGGGATGLTYSTPPLGRYTKIGRNVFVTGTVALSAKGSSTGTAVVAGLPFVSANDGIPVAASVGSATGMSVVSGAVIGLITPNSSQLSLLQAAGGSASSLSHSNFSNASAIIFSAVYDV